VNCAGLEGPRFGVEVTCPAIRFLDALPRDRIDARVTVLPITCGSDLDGCVARRSRFRHLPRHRRFEPLGRMCTRVRAQVFDGLLLEAEILAEMLLLLREQAIP